MKKNKITKWLSERNDIIISDNVINEIIPHISTRAIDRQTSKDLLLPDYFRSIDKAISTPGRNVLYACLHAPLTSEADIQSRKILMKSINDNEKLSLSLDKILWKSRFSPTESVDAVLFDRVESLFTREKMFLFLLTFIFLVIAIPLLYSQMAFYSILLFFIITFLLFAKNLSIYNTYIPGLINLALHYYSAQKIVKLFHNNGTNNMYIDRLADTLPKLNPIIPSLKILGTGSFTANDIFHLTLFWIKCIFCIDLAAYNTAINILLRDRASIIQFYVCFGTVDALSAVSKKIRADRELFCKPEFISGQGISAVKTLNPLLTNAVNNSVDMSSCMILTGSNMAGKSTFLRTIGLNAVLAMSIGYCYAESFKLPLTNIVSIINKHDDMNSGESFYFYEAKRLSEMINNRSEEKYLFLIDELLSGTNSLERVSASIAIVRYLLTINNIISIIATHDVTIAEDLKEVCDCYYFSDHIRNEKMEFDYKLKEGIIKTTNAIKMLAILGIPSSVIEEAEKAVHVKTGEY